MALIEHRPNATEEELVAAYREYEVKTTALLMEPDIWAAIEALASALCEKGKLMAEEVEAILNEVGSSATYGPEALRRWRDKRDEEASQS